MAEAKRPTSIKVGPHTYKVFYKKSMDPYNEWSGLSAHDDLEIWIHAVEHISAQRETLVHEVDHCIQHIFGAGLEAPTGEQQAHARGMGWYTVMRENPKLIAWLLS